MPIINGKKRYIPEEDRQSSAPEGPRRGPVREGAEGMPPAQAPSGAKKRYHRAEVQEEAAPRTIKRYRKGESGTAAAVEAAVTQDIGNFVGGYEFSVQLSLGSVSFSKVMNIGGQIEVGSFVEGGNNDYPIVYQVPRRRPDVIVFEKGVTDSTAANLILSLLKEGTKVYSILIFVKKNKSIVKTFSITEGIILSRKYSTLDANASSLVIERLEIAHTGITEV